MSKKGNQPMQAGAVIQAMQIMSSVMYTSADEEAVKAAENAIDAGSFKRELLGILVKYGTRPIKTTEMSLGERHVVHRAWDESLMDLTADGFLLTPRTLKFIQKIGG
jgi:hypothetical protein